MARSRFELPMEDIINDYYDGMSIEALAEKYKISANTIYNRFRESGVKDNVKREKALEMARDYIEADMTILEIALEYYVSESTVINYLKSVGVSLKQSASKLKAANPSEVIKLYQVDKLNTREIASIYNCSHRAISDYLKKHNVALRTRHEGRSIYYQKRKSKGVNAIS